MGFKNIALAIGLAFFAVVGVADTTKAARPGGRPAGGGGGGGARVARPSGGGGSARSMHRTGGSSRSSVRSSARRASFRPTAARSSSARLRSTTRATKVTPAKRAKTSTTKAKATSKRLAKVSTTKKAPKKLAKVSASTKASTKRLAKVTTTTTKTTPAGTKTTRTVTKTHGARGHGWRRGWTRYRHWAPFWTTAFLWGSPFDPFWGPYVTWSFGVGFGNPYFYPRFGLWYHPGWHSWYYPRYGYWFYPQSWYWYYPWCGYSVYYNPDPIIRDNISYRALTIDRDTEKGMFYAIYYKPAADDKKVVGKEVRLYRLTDPKPLKGKQSKLLIPQATKDRDRVVVIAKNKSDLKEKLVEDKTDGRIIIPIDNGEKDRTEESGKKYNVVKEGKITQEDESQLKKLIDDKQKSELSALEEKIQKADVKKYKDQQKQPDTAAPAAQAEPAAVE